VKEDLALSTTGADKRGMEQESELRVPTVDFDHNRPEHARDWRQIYSELRGRCPIAHSDAWGGFHVISRYEDVATVGRSHRTYSSGRYAAGRRDGGVTIPPVAEGGPAAIPIELDPPEHFAYRRVLTPWFSRAAVAQRWEPFVREVVTALVDEAIETGRLELIGQLIGPATAMLGMEIAGLPLCDWRVYAPPYHEMMHVPQDSPEWPRVIGQMTAIYRRIAREVAARAVQPRDDLISHLLQSEVDGTRIAPTTVANIINVLLSAAVDTTASASGHIFYWLSAHPVQRQRLIDEPELIPAAREELLRYFSPTPVTGRTVTRETVLGGYRLMPGDRILTAFASANLDPDVWEDPETVDFDRNASGHLAFGIGVHRCLGLHVARATLAATLGETLRRMPDFVVDEANSVRYDTIHMVNGWVQMPITFTPGARVGSSIDLGA
jgi:cytochrome P450